MEFIQLGRGQFFVEDIEPEFATATAKAEYQLVLASTGPGPNAAGPLLGLDVGAFSNEPTARTISGSGALLTLGFDEAFCRLLGRPDAFAEGEVLGTVSLTATGE